MEHAHQLLAWGRTIMAAGCVGTARAALDATLAHVTSRRQFGRAIGTFGASRSHVAAMASRVFAMDAVACHAARRAPTDAFGSLAAVAKVFCSEEAFEVCDRALQLHGALGFLEPTGIARMLRDCRITRIFEGANDVLLVRLAAARIASRETLGREAAGAGACHAAAARLDAAADYLRSRYGVGVVKHQTVLGHLARAEVYVRAAVAVSLAPTTRDDALVAALALEDLATRAERHLDAIATAEGREEREARLTDRLYGVDLARTGDLDRAVAP
jgi:alkylation response protein AidB-like acyl-CoA dehydrogenase